MKQIINEEIRKFLKEYFLDGGSKVEDIFGALNVFTDTYNKDSMIINFLDDMVDRDKYEKKFIQLHKKYNAICKSLDSKLKKYYKKPIPDKFIEKLDSSVYDGSDSYDELYMVTRELPGVWNKQIRLVQALINELQKKK